MFTNRVLRKKAGFKNKVCEVPDVGTHRALQHVGLKTSVKTKTQLSAQVGIP
jgi:hypothetical protein